MSACNVHNPKKNLMTDKREENGRDGQTERKMNLDCSSLKI